MIEILHPVPGVRVGLKHVDAAAGDDCGSRAQRERAAVREVIDAMLGPDAHLEHYPNGAPYLPGHPELHISVSHCRRMVAVALSESAAVGIDIEEPRQQLLRVAERVFSATELAALPEAGPERLSGLTRMWTHKEALYKLYPSPAACDFRNNITTAPPAVCGRPARILISRPLPAHPEIWMTLVTEEETTTSFLSLRDLRDLRVLRELRKIPGRPDLP